MRYDGLAKMKAIIPSCMVRVQGSSLKDTHFNGHV